MPHDLDRLQADIAQVQHDAAGFGTGRLIAENLILTSAHVLWRSRADREAGLNPKLQGWKVRLVRDSASGAWPFRYGNSVIWHNPKCDLALIQLTDSGGDALHPMLQFRVATVEGSNPHAVEARGYPRASKQAEGPRDLTPALGRLTAADPDRPLRFGIDPCDLPKDPNAGWPGMSGSAVLLRDAPDPNTIWIYGVVREVPPNFNGQLHIARLADPWMQDRVFRRLLIEAGAEDKDAEDPSDLVKVSNALAPLIAISNYSADGCINLEDIIRKIILEHKVSSRKHWIGLSQFIMPTQFSPDAFWQCIFVGLINTFGNEKTPTHAPGLVDLMNHKDSLCYRLVTPSSSFIDITCNLVASAARAALESGQDESTKSRIKADIIHKMQDWNFSAKWNRNRKIDFVDLRCDPRSKTVSVTSVDDDQLSTRPQDYPERLGTTSEMLRYISSLANSDYIVDLGNPFYPSGYAWVKFITKFIDNRRLNIDRIRVNLSDLEEWDFVNPEFDYEVWGAKSS